MSYRIFLSAHRLCVLLFGMSTLYAADDFYDLICEASKGNVVAQYNLGRMYQDGNGVKQDDTMAFKWFKRSADLGDSDAQCMLGWMYKYGRGVEMNIVKAFWFYAQAAEQGNKEATKEQEHALNIFLPQELKDSYDWTDSFCDLGLILKSIMHFYESELMGHWKEMQKSEVDTVRGDIETLIRECGNDLGLQKLSRQETS